MWSVAVFEPAFPGRSRIANGSPVPSGPWSRNAHNGWNPKPRLNVGAACSFSECEVTRVASRSMTNGCFASLPWSGACSPARRHACSRAAARAVSIAFSAAGASPARAAIALDTVGSDDTPVDARLGPQHRQGGQAVTAQRQTQRQIRDHLARIMNRERLAPPDQSGGQETVQPGGRDGPGEQDPAGLPDRSSGGRVDTDTGIQAGNLHPESAPRFGICGP